MLRAETAGDPARERAALAGLRAYQTAKRPARLEPPPAIARAGRAVLRDYGGDGQPAIFIPSLINPPHVLDLDEDRSLLRWLVGQGLRPLLVDWGAPRSDEADRSIAGHVETLLLPLIDEAARQHGHVPPLAGYCLGGTMAIAAAAQRPVAGLALLAAPWRFGGYPADARATLADFWAQAGPVARAIGLLPMEALQTCFWRLDPARTVAKYVALAGHGADAAAVSRFVALEDWANDGPPLTWAAACELFEDFFAEDQPGIGRWMARELPSVPVLDIASTRDQIVPLASAATGDPMRIALGHVGMIVGGEARERVWRPLADWLVNPRATGDTARSTARHR